MKFKDKGIAKIGLFVISTLLFLGLLELMAGYAFEHLPAKYSNGKRLVSFFIGETPKTPGAIESHPYLLYQNTSNYYADGILQHNSFRYRGKEFDFKKADSSIRILALGGSTTYSYPYVKNPVDTWVSQLEIMLKEKINVDIETINGGLPNATTAELLSSYIFRHKYLKPDILIIHTGGNDVIPLLFADYNQEYSHYRGSGTGLNPRKFEFEILSASNFLKLFYALWLNSSHSIYQAKPYSLDKIDRESVLAMVKQNNSDGFRRNLDTLIKIAESDNTKVVLFPFLQARQEMLTNRREDLKGLEKALVAGLDKHYTIMKELSEKYDIPFIIPKQSLFKDAWFIDNCHLNELGEKMKANILFEHFSNSKDRYFLDANK